MLYVILCSFFFAACQQNYSLMDKLIYTKNDLRAKCFSKVPVC